MTWINVSFTQHTQHSIILYIIYNTFKLSIIPSLYCRMLLLSVGVPVELFLGCYCVLSQCKVFIRPQYEYALLQLMIIS